MSEFHRHMLDQLPGSWLHLIAQGVNVVISRENVKLDFTAAPDVIQMPCSAAAFETFPKCGSDGYARYRKSLLPIRGSV
jgi:hypothetical protein